MLVDILRDAFGKQLTITTYNSQGFHACITVIPCENNKLYPPTPITLTLAFCKVPHGYTFHGSMPLDKQVSRNDRHYDDVLNALRQQVQDLNYQSTINNHTALIVGGELTL